jgi:hypothetical protein
MVTETPSSAKVNHRRFEIAQLCVMFESCLIADRVLADGMTDLQGVDRSPWLRDTFRNSQITATERTLYGVTRKKLLIAPLFCEEQSGDALTSSLC